VTPQSQAWAQKSTVWKNIEEHTFMARDVRRSARGSLEGGQDGQDDSRLAGQKHGEEPGQSRHRRLICSKTGRCCSDRCSCRQLLHRQADQQAEHRAAAVECLGPAEQNSEASPFSPNLLSLTEGRSFIEKEVGQGGGGRARQSRRQLVTERVLVHRCADA